MSRFTIIAMVIVMATVAIAQSNYEIMLSRPDITGLTGGGATNLDGIPTTGLAVGTILIIYDGSETRIYRLTAGTDAENSPEIIRPDDFADPGNAKVWKTSISSDPGETGFSPTGGWALTGNTGAGNFLGSTDAQPLSIRTNNTEKVRITTQGQIETYNTGFSVFIGEGAGANDDLTNNRNVFVGYQAGNSNTKGSNNTANGYYALYSNTEGWENTANGCYALYSNTTGYNNTANGIEALQSNTTGSYNTANGITALYSNTTGWNNTANGCSALYSNTTGYNNTANGRNALVLVNPTAPGEGENNTGLGYLAGDNITTGSRNIIIGANVDAPIATGDDQLNIGDAIYGDLSTGDVTIGGGLSITDIPDDAAPDSVLTLVDGQVRRTLASATGSWALTGNTGAGNFLGSTDAQPLSIRTNNTEKVRITTQGQIETYNTGLSVFIGAGAGANDDLTDNRNVFIGYLAGNTGTTASYCAAYGYEALYSNSTGNDNIAIGADALYSNDDGNWNTAVGVAALFSNTSGHGNTAFGRNALTNVDGTVATEGEYNTGLGYNAGDNITSGSRNIIIGANVDAPVAAGDDQLNIGDAIYGDLSTGNVAIGTTATPTSKLQVVGLPVYANNAAAIAGGLTIGAFYRTGGDPDVVCIVH